MKDLRYYEHKEDEYVVIYDYTGDKEKPFLVEIKIAGHRHEERFDRFFKALKAFNDGVQLLKTN
ncbi:hypothetical protein CB3_026 [Pectobacterium phage vB_PatP_CB3]|uniref:Uncharacterized protein n=2 Tax=Cbunavirus CB4 TaxID=2845777 RepID=A0A2P9J4X2_9CAUD|nr:hypothetical protein HWB09_gp026 [Pectobacterium phage vB_PatP_CB4]AQT27868.1 hypothetical protein CB4_026 [Pectobacterium phage vB_PatP_CB4]ARB11850.1 hypothetical protein CB3_026 [Pectobacterium phage vB_PatP_CB3]